MTFPAYPAYKDSGVDWLGTVPDHWTIYRSKNVFSERNIKAAESDEQLTASQKYGVIPQKLFCQLEDQKVMQVILGRDILKKAEVNDFVISMRSFQGGLEFCSYSGAVSSAYVPLHACRDISNRFFKHLFKSTPFISALQNTSNLVRDGQALRYNNFVQLSLPFPTISEQITIGAFLDHETVRIDALIEEQQRLIELLKEKRQALISHAVTKGLDPTVPMKDSGVEWLGEVPAHWRAVRLRHCLVNALTYGANESSDEANLEHPRYIRITDLNDDGTLSTETYKSLPPEKSEPYMLEHGDVLFARSGATVGKSFLYSQECGPACYAGYLIRARADKRTLIPMYLWMGTQSRQYEQFIGENNIQATIQNVSAEKYGNMWIALPPIEEQETILAALKVQLSRFKVLIGTAAGTVELLNERRSALISAAVTGKIDVRGWQSPASAQVSESAVAEAV